ncbi:putative ribonuclease H-like domain-containing protein [Tanacetum coccineum]
MTPRAVLLKTGLTPLNTVRPVNTAHPKPAVHSAKSMSHFSKQAQSTAQRPFYKQTTLTRKYVHTAMRHYHTERPRAGNTARSYTGPVNAVRAKGGKPQQNDTGFVDSGCSRHMTGNIAYLLDFKEFDGGYVTFRGGAHGGRISGKGTLKTDSLDFEDVYFVNELKFNLFSVSQMCDKKNHVLFIDTECLILSPNFKLPDENQILLKIPRKDNMYSFDMKNIVPKESLTCLVAKATLDESMLWHRRLGHINFKNINKLVKDNLDKQHGASCKSKVLNPITKPLFMLHMDLFGPTFVSSLMHKKYCLVVTDDYSRVIEQIYDNFCKEKGIRREYSVARTPQQNGVAERRNRTLIEAARTMLADSKLPTTFWAEAVSTTCYVQNRVLIVKPHNKTPYELFRGIKPALTFMKPFGCHVTILNNLDSLGKFDGKSDEGFFVGYSLSSKDYRVYNTRTRKVEENLHIGFLKNKPMIEGNGLKWMFDIDSLTQSMNYVLVTAGTSTNESVGTQGDQNAGIFPEKGETSQECIVMPIWKDASYFDSSSKTVGNDEPRSASDDLKHVEDGPSNEDDGKDKSEDDSSTKQDNTADQPINTTSPGLNTGGIRLNTVGSSVNTATPKDMVGPSSSFEATHDEFLNDEDASDVNLGNIPKSYEVPTTPHTRININHPLSNEEPKIISKALSDPAWVGAMQEELLQFKLQNVWILVDLPKVHRAIGTKWVFRNKKDERGIVIRNKARLIEEEVYVCQPLGFEDPDYPDKVYKVMKALYGLHQAPRAWYETLSNYLLGNGFHRGKIDQTLFIKKQKEDILLMSSMGELTFFLGLQVQQRKDGIFISQDKYVDAILRKFNYTYVKSASTPINLEKPLVKDGDGTDVDEHLYRSMIRSLMYLTTSRPDIMFAVCACAIFQVTLKASHLLAVKRIFRYLKGKLTLGLWYSRDSPFELVAYTDSDYDGATQDIKSTTGGC